jgi:transcriptional regulator GlxA family with amidase domain
MKVVIVAFDDFTDVDTFLPLDFFHRVTVPYGADYRGEWRVRLLADRPQIKSYTGVSVEAHGNLSEARTADGVFVVSGDGSRAKLADPAFKGALGLNPERQVIAAIDSGTLVLAALGLLEGLSATTYPTVMDELEAAGIRAEERSIVVYGNLATGGGCLASLDLCTWMVARLLSREAALKVRASFAPNEGFASLARLPLGLALSGASNDF